MTMSKDIEAEAIQRAAESYRAKGYRVVEQPQGSDRPAFLGDYMPDLIAFGPTESVVVEVKVGTRAAHGMKLQPIAERIAKEPGWRFSIVVAPEDEPFPGIPTTEPLSLDAASQRLEQSQALASTRTNVDAAYLLVWSAGEAILRKFAEAHQMPFLVQSPSALIKELYSAGELSQSQYDRLMRCLKLRNGLAHGFDSPATQADVDELAGVARELIADMSGTAK